MERKGIERQQSIKTRIGYSFMGIIVISIFIFILMLSVFLKEYYYKSVEDILTDQIRMSASFYSRYFSDSSLEDNVMDNVDVFWKFTSAQVQIIDNSGTVLMDSIGVYFTDKLETSDVKRALDGEAGKWIGRVAYTDDLVMSVSHPLEANSEVVGVLRFTTSLEPINEQLRYVIWIFILMGILTIAISSIISFILANGVVSPIKQVTRVAEKMAKGDFQVRCIKESNDEVGRLADTLNYMANEIMEKEQIKNEFIASVSHELRTPLTSIKGWAVILNNTNPEEVETFRDGLKIIEKETERLSGMVEELLDFSKLLSGEISLKLKRTNLVDLIEYIKRHMTPVAQRNRINFEVEYPDQLPEISIDENRIKQVLINVLDNAFKFTSQGGMVSFKTYIEDNFIVMVVLDNGCGIPSHELPYVKDKFFKGKNSKAASGIGLSVSNEIISKHNGQLDIESQEGKGTKVIIRLPIS
ncbi:MAG: HAMP domain-containing histidine kinase [Clostridiales bacterium]|jgi:signal transduction histidine kinase|nr:HAMP domain-containing histidine kinase [Clostridiales bacterium]